MSLYNLRGVSAQKEEVHDATKKLQKGLFLNSFCQLFPDYLIGDENFVNAMHADGAGTKSILAHLYHQETNDISVWEGIAKDAIIMNLDDLICTGIYDKILFSSTIDRNKKYISAEILATIINATNNYFEELKQWGINITYMGGETADVGDVVRTIAVNGTMTARWNKNKIITNEKIKPGNIIIGLNSYGTAKYEKEFNSGIGSNGLTSARHDVLSDYYKQFTETFEPSLSKEITYIGKYRMTDFVPVPEFNNEQIQVGKLLLSPTRTYAPFVKELLLQYFDEVNGMIHCSGGGQTKCLKYLNNNIKIVKNNLPTVPTIFNLIQNCSGADDKEMYQVFNMGVRLEIYTNEKNANNFIALADSFGLEAQIIGRVEESQTKSLEIHTPKSNIIKY